MKSILFVLLTILSGCTTNKAVDLQLEEIVKIKKCISGLKLDSAIERCDVNLPLSEKEYASLESCLVSKNIHKRYESNIFLWCNGWEASVSFERVSSVPKIDGIYKVLP
ncbi:hypothetical protein [Saccharophagus degradans]|uniref:Lipoprotein n=1 Tax=Saccharophagus degradans TaxID=86304 RepID=A0AAW7X3C6_9GAMM|nr:hypothetical protein [Saccharophagus degradans]MDO6421342.1 hypothetical protein [Saccharophagus degradans]MDO6605747.1 hypothetical protein [Saccharophagus degradans]